MKSEFESHKRLLPVISIFMQEKTNGILYWHFFQLFPFHPQSCHHLHVKPGMLLLGLGLGLKAKFLGLGLGLGTLWPWP